MGMNFVCRLITIEDILKCSYGLNKTEIALLKYLIEEKEELEIEEIMKKIKKDRTTIQRGVYKLVEKDLIKRRQINLQKPKSELKDKVMKIFDGFKETVGNEIQRW